MGQRIDGNLIRQPVHPDITAELVEDLVHTFYGRVRSDVRLGPLFEEIIRDNWPAHLERMVLFWGNLMGVGGPYKGDPLGKHRPMEGLSRDDFSLWLALFDQTAKDVCGEEAAPYFSVRAHRIAESLQLGLFGLPSLQG